MNSMQARLLGCTSEELSINAHDDEVTGKLMKELYDKMQWNMHHTTSDLAAEHTVETARMSSQFS